MYYIWISFTFINVYQHKRLPALVKTASSSSSKHSFSTIGHTPWSALIEEQIQRSRNNSDNIIKAGPMFLTNDKWDNLKYLYKENKNQKKLSIEIKIKYR